MERLVSTYVHNPFDPIKSRETKELVGRYSVQQCINEFCSNTEAGYDYVVSINGEFLPEEQNLSEYYLEYGSIVICAVPQGGGGKNPLRIIAMIAVVVIAVAFVQPQLMTFLGGTVGLTGSTLTAAAYVGTTLFVTAGNLLVNALLPLSVDNAGAPLGDFSNSSTYGWDITSNETKEGSCWPVLYGRAKIAPPIIAKYVEVYNDKQYLNLLCGVADHSMGSLDSATMQLDGNSLSTGDDLIIETRLGEIDQSIIQAFGDTRSLKSVGSKLTTDWTTVTTDGDEVEGISVSVSLPKGLWYAADDGSLTQTMVDLNIEYAPTSATTGNWVSIQTKTVSSSLATVDHWSAGYWVGFENWVEVEQGSTSATQHEEGETYSYPALEWHLVNLSGSYNSSPGARVLLLWHWKLAGEALFVTSIATSADCITIAGSQSSPMHRVFFRDHVSAATSYDIRMRLNSAPPTTSRYGNDVYFEYIEEIMYDDFSYPGATLLAVRALATDKISGGIPLITILANRGSVPVWNSTLATWCDYCSDNPAWASWDMLYNKNYGGGIDKDRIDYTAFATWATFCSANSLKCNIYFDQIVNFRKALDTVGQLGRGRVVQLGSTFTCFVDKVESTPIQGFMFNVANMAKNSFTEEFLAMDDRANAIEVTYWDEDYDYDRKTVELYGSDFDTTTREIKTSQVNLIGCTNRVMAIKHGQYLLNCNRYQTITASWEADIDSLGCMPWDVVEVQHDIPQWGYGGRLIQAGTLSTVILDQQITMATTGTYVIRIKSSSDDSVQEKTIDAVAVSTTTCTISPIATFDSIAATYDMYTVYENTTSTKWFRILHLGRKDDLTRKVVAIEYNSNVYSDSYTCATPESSSELDMVKGLRAEEIWKGGAETRVQVVWTGFALAWHVWHRRTSGEMVWIDDGIVRNPYIEIKNLDYGIEHEICVSYTNDVKEGLTVTITPVGKTTAPGNVTGLAATSIEDGVSFSWTKVSDFDLVGYKVRTGIKWQAATTYVPTVNVIPTDGSAYRYICLTGGKTSATTEPSWPTATAATITDGTVVWQEDSSDWVWQQTATVNFIRDLDASELEAQAKGNFSISAWVVGVDAFDNVSDTAATITGVCNNYKPYISVGPTTVQGTFTDFKKAVDQLPSGGGQIAIKNGTYNLTDSIIVPAKNLHIIGESQEGTILTMTEKNKIVFQWASEDYTGLQQSFSNFTINSGNSTSSTYNAIFYVQSSSLNEFNLLVECLSFNLYDDGSTNSTGDIGIHILRLCKANLILKKCNFNNGLTGILGGSRAANMIIENNIFNGQKGCAVNCDSKYATIRYNHFVEQYYCGTSGLYFSDDGTYKVLGNSILFSTSASGEIIGIKIYGTALSEISGNVILMPTTTYNPDAIGIQIEGLIDPCTGILCNSNQIDIHSDTNYALGIYVAIECCDSNIRSNVIKIDSTNASGNHYGIYFGPSCLRNVISANQIDLVNTGANDKGIYIYDNDNQGVNNVLYNCGIGVIDAGTGNSINKIGAGTF